MCTADEDKVVLEFPPSPFVRNSPWFTTQPFTIEVPQQGTIEELPVESHPTVHRKQAFTSITPRGIEMQLDVALPFLDNKLLMKWVGLRDEWVGIHYQAWLRSDTLKEEHSYRGPYALTDFCALRLLLAHRFPEEAIPSFIEQERWLSAALKMSPEKIRELAAQERRSRTPVEH